MDEWYIAGLKAFFCFFAFVAELLDFYSALDNGHCVPRGGARGNYAGVFEWVNSVELAVGVLFLAAFD